MNQKIGLTSLSRRVAEDASLRVSFAIACLLYVFSADATTLQEVVSSSSTIAEVKISIIDDSPRLQIDLTCGYLNSATVIRIVKGDPTQVEFEFRSLTKLKANHVYLVFSGPASAVWSTDNRSSELHRRPPEDSPFYEFGDIDSEQCSELGGSLVAKTSDEQLPFDELILEGRNFNVTEGGKPEEFFLGQSYTMAIFGNEPRILFSEIGETKFQVENGVPWFRADDSSARGPRQYAYSRNQFIRLLKEIANGQE